ncbi:MAG: pyridoxal-dependent decarboxylase [Pseudomonadota bacterium]
MDKADFRKWSDKANDWIEQYFDTLADQPVRAQTKPGEIAARLPKSPPDAAEPMEKILDDFAAIIPGGITHWQHPRFFAYFTANAAPVSMIAEQITNAVAANCMLWQTSPAATELEQVMVDWMRDAVGLPAGYVGVIQDSASSATLSAILTMRERSQNFEGNKIGYAGAAPARIYCSAQVHSSIDKACWIAGIGQDNLVKIETDDTYGMRADLLKAAIEADIANGFKPAGLVLCTGGTSIGASDALPPLLEIAREYGLYTHLDAAWAGSAMICPEFRAIWEGVEDCDSIVFNPHKWLGANFDCSIQFLKDPTAQIRTLGIKPTYLLSENEDKIVNFSEWTVPLGRRFRALKIWFLIRAHGLDGLREMIRNHVAWAQELEAKIDALPDFKVVTKSRWSLFTFQYCPKGQDANDATQQLLARINEDGRIYLTQTSIDGHYVIRFACGTFDCAREDVMSVFDVLEDLKA